MDTAWRIAPIEEAELRLPKPSPAPRPTNNVITPTTMGTQIVVPLVPDVLVVDGVVAWLVDFVAAGVGDATAAAFTVKTKAPWSGSPSWAETVFHCTT